MFVKELSSLECNAMRKIREINNMEKLSSTLSGYDVSVVTELYVPILTTTSSLTKESSAWSAQAEK